MSKVWRLHVWRNKTEKTVFYLQLWIDLVPSNMNSPNFWHFISQLGIVLYRNQMVLDQQGSAALEIPNHWISPTVNSILYGEKTVLFKRHATRFTYFVMLHSIYHIFNQSFMFNTHFDLKTDFKGGAVLIVPFDTKWRSSICSFRKQVEQF